jgi:hypothetical protein
MFKKHMTPIGIHRKGTLSSHPNKQKSAIQPAIDAARGGGANPFQDYTKATPMANPQAPADDMSVSDSWGNDGGI